MIQVTGLKEESVRKSLRTIGKRSPLGILTQLLSFYLFVVPATFFHGNPAVSIGLTTLIICFLVRAGLALAGDRILNLKHGQLLFRGLFFITSLMYVTVWDFFCLSSFADASSGLIAVELYAFIGTFISTVVNAVSFDLFNALFLILGYALPTFTYLVFFSEFPMAKPLGIVMGLYGIYSLVMVINVRRSEIKALINFDFLVEKDRALERAHQDLLHNHALIQSMLESIDEAFLLFDAQGVCTSSASSSSKKLLGFDPQGKHISEIIETNPAKRKSVADWFKIVLSDLLDFDDVASQGAQILSANAGATVLKLKYHAVRDAQQSLTSVVLTGTDVTKEMQAQKKSNEERERSEMVMRIFDYRASFRPFLATCEERLSSISNWDGEDFEGLKRDLHTLKGTAMLFGAASFARDIYEAELKIREFKGEDFVTFIRENGRNVLSRFHYWREREMDLFTKLGVFEDGTIQISIRKLIEIRSSVLQSRPSSADEALDRALSLIENTEFGDLLKEFSAHVHETATKLGKKATLIVSSPADPIYVQPEDYRETVRSFIHVINNALDHGLEATAERSAAGKSETGTITIRYERYRQATMNWIRIFLEDDGHGINIEKIRAKLRAGRNPEQADEPPLSVAMHVFDNGVSTRERVTELSGQGVGMGAVRAAIIKARGKIEISKTDTTGTTFQILLPDKSIQFKTMSECPPLKTA